MTWSRFDDAARKHPKAVMAGNDAWGFWAAAIMYCNQYGTDGFIPDAALAGEVMPVAMSKAKAKSLADKLCAARIHTDKPGLFTRDDTRGGYVVNDFLDWNPSKSETDAKRKKDRARKKGDGEPPGGSGGNPGGTPPEDTRNPGGGATDSVSLTRVPARVAPAPGPISPAKPGPTIPAITPQSSPDEKVPCPVPLPLDDEDFGALEMNNGIPRAVAEANLRAWASDQRASKANPRTVEAWIKCGLPWLRGKWSDANRQVEMRALANPKAPEPIATEPERVKSFADVCDESALPPARRAKA